MINLSEFEWAQPLWLWGLLVAPLMVWWIWRQPPLYRRIQAFADAHLLPHLLHTPPARRTLGQGLWWAAVWSLGVLALAGPRWDYVEQTVVKPRADLMILLDLSESMRVTDVGQSRLQQALQDIEDILSEAKELHIGLMVFAGLPHLVAPLSDDYQTIRNLLYELDTELISVQGSRLALALQQTKAWLSARETDAAGLPHVLVISDGDFSAEDWQQANAVDIPFPLHVLGVGTEQGDLIRLQDGDWVRNAAGEVVISKLNEAQLQQLAQRGNGLYRRADFRRDDTQAILSAVRSSVEANYQDQRQQRLWHERFYLLVVLMMVLMLPWFRR